MTDLIPRTRRSSQVRQMPAQGFQTRETSDGLTFEGYASTFDNPYSMGWFSEVVRPGAFSKTLSESPDVRFLVNHSGLPLARTRSGTLSLDQDSTGLFVRASLDPGDPDVAALVPKMRRGDLDEMSFGFRIVGESWSPDYSQCDLLELALDGGDVSVVTYPANPNTSAAIRSALGRKKASPEVVRGLYRELREGKAISAANAEILSSVLEALGNVDDLFGTASDHVSTASDALYDLLALNDPDPQGPDASDQDADGDDDSSDPTDTDSDSDSGANTASKSRGLSLAMARAIADASRLRAS